MVWKKKFIDNLISADNSNDEKAIDMCFQFKHKALPRFLYKYRTFNIDSLKNLQENTLYLSYPKDFNDPFDSTICLSYEKLIIESIKNNCDNPFENCSDRNKLEALKMLEKGICAEEVFSKYLGIFRTKKSWSRYTNKARAEIESSLSKLNEDYQKNFLMCCFSEVIDNVLMWSHYSQNHTGFCIEYDIASLDYDDPLTYFMYPVIYTRKPFLNSSSINYADNINLIVAQLNKSSDWSYEKEFRFLLNPNSGTVYNMPIKPSKIYLGNKISNENLKLILKIAKKMDVPIAKMQLKINSFKMDFVDIY